MHRLESVLETERNKANRVVIVLPTYNEKETIGKLLDAILSQGSRVSNAHLCILVVDDLSPDGTGEIVKDHSQDNENVHLLSGAKRGLGAAYKRGLVYAIDKLRADVVFQMDADFSHDPDDIPRLLSKVMDGSDFVIGSRYIPGGSIPDHWSRVRKAISRWGNITVRYIARLQIKDCTSGYRAIRASLLQKLALDRVRGDGYAFLVGLLHEAIRKGAKVSEVPIKFSDRVYGKSKLGMTDIAEAIVRVFAIGLSNLLWHK